MQGLLDTPREHLSEEEVQSALAGGGQVRWGVDVLNSELKESGINLDVHDMEVSWAHRTKDPLTGDAPEQAKVRRTGSLTYTDIKRFNPLSALYRPWIELRSSLTYAKIVLETTPTGYWRLGEESGTTAVDASGNGYDGTYQGSPTLGAEGALVADDDTAVDFVGASYVSLGTDIRATPGNGSFECWVDTTQWTDTAGHGLYQNVLSWANSANSVALFRYSHSVSNDAQFYFRIIDPSGTIQDLASQWRNFFGTVDGWHHVVGTWDATYMRLYIDGVEVTSRTYTPPNALRTDTQISRGHDQPGNGHELDEPALYDYALTADEVKRHYDAGRRAPRRWAKFYQGVYVPSLPNWRTDGTIVTRDLQLDGREVIYSEHVLSNPLTLSADTVPTQWVADDLQMRFRETDVSGIEQSTKTLSNNDFDAPRSFDAGTSLADVYATLLTYVGQTPVFCDAQGRPRSTAIVDPQSRESEWFYGEGTTVLRPATIEAVNPKLPNVLRFSANRGPSLPEEGNGIRTVLNQNDGPGSMNQQGRNITFQVDVNAANQTELDAIAKARAQWYFAGGGLKYNGAVLLNPLHDDDDIVRLERDIFGVSGLWIVASWSHRGTGSNLEEQHVTTQLQMERLTGAAFISEVPPEVGVFGTEEFGVREFGEIEVVV